MNKPDRQTQFLKIYRQHLRREMDAMGYGQPHGNKHNSERQTRTNTAPIRQIITVALMALGIGSAR